MGSCRIIGADVIDFPRARHHQRDGWQDDRRRRPSARPRTLGITIRDTVYREDDGQACTGNGPRALASLREFRNQRMGLPQPDAGTYNS